MDLLNDKVAVSVEEIACGLRLLVPDLIFEFQPTVKLIVRLVAVTLQTIARLVQVQDEKQ